MKIALGSDHRGAEAVQSLRKHLEAHGHVPVILGECTGDSCDYPDSAFLVASAVSDGDAQIGILVCGSGIGMSIAANKVAGVRAAVAFDERAAEMSRRHNDANVFCLAGDRATIEQMTAMVETFVAAPFDGGRHERRVRKIGAIEAGTDPAALHA